MHGRMGAFSMAAGHDEEGVTIQKAENGYLVTLTPPWDPRGHSRRWGALEAHEEEALLEHMEKSRPRVYVFPEIESVLEAIKEFLLDGKLPRPK